MRIAVFPGVFDPFTRGHQNLLKRALQHFDKVVIAVAHSTTKSTVADAFARAELVKKCTRGLAVDVQVFEGLLTDFCIKQGVFTVIRGIRDSADFCYEKNLGSAYKLLCPQIELVYWICDSDSDCISSSIVREIAKNNGDLTNFVPKEILADILKLYSKEN